MTHFPSEEIKALFLSLSLANKGGCVIHAFRIRSGLLLRHIHLFIFTRKELWILWNRKNNDGWNVNKAPCKE